MINIVKTQPFMDQKPGTSGLRKKVTHIQQKNYLENFVQAMFDQLSESEKTLIIIGGDGRFYNDKAIQCIVKIAAANAIKRVVIGQNGILSTPAVSNLIRQNSAGGGVILSASHNPGGPNGDFGIKFNNANGSPAPEVFTEALYQASQNLEEYRIVDGGDVDLSSVGHSGLNGMGIDVIDSVIDYSALMQQSFDFSWMKTEFAEKRLSLVFDAMNAVTGPYATSVFGHSLGAEVSNIINAIPLDDFGGEHPDPNLVHAKALIAAMSIDGAPLLGAASDGDGDRNLILGKDTFVSPSDSLAVIAEYSDLIPQFSNGLQGVARSMPTSTALDRVAKAKGLECYETPTGWKFFGNLLDAGKISLCGEESFGTGGDHIREKDGIWTVLCWLTICGKRQQTPAQILMGLWETYGRSYYCRYDYENIPQQQADQVMAGLLDTLPELSGSVFSDYTVERADSFAYQDSVDGSLTENQGIRVFLKGGHRIIYRLSGTGTDNATIRVYLEKIENDASKLADDVFTTLKVLGDVANEIASINEITDLSEPSVMT
ncbi:alpha-D-glucose phosphate-specific phosphoglucomutase [Gammaproteobacteria bacterium 42_54_T18]|nr:alpha-D-glucose phosphate-specific phosphoglucomutase [Gammaproteobacteria bacterium 42_54_T18]